MKAAAAKVPAEEAFTLNVREILAERELEQIELAKRLGMDPGNLSRILNGKEAVTLERAERFADALQLPLWQLLAYPMPNRNLAMQRVTAKLREVNARGPSRAISKRSG